MPTIRGWRVQWHVIAFACIALGAAWEVWTTVPRPGHVLDRLAPSSGCPRALPARLAAPPEMSVADRCVLLWTAFRYPARVGIIADTSVIEEATIMPEGRHAGRRSPRSRPVWEVTLWLRPAAGPERLWRVTIDRHDGDLWLEKGALLPPRRM